MKKMVFNLWKETPGICLEVPTIEVYIPEIKKSDCAIVILPGGGYTCRAPHEGEAYAKFFNENGIVAFVCNYRVSPHRFPLELLDARRAIRYVRYHAEEYGIDKNKVAIMGSSAGGHLAALTSTYFGKIEGEGKDEIDGEKCIPDAQILCYPVIKLSVDRTISHVGSCVNLLGIEQIDKAHDYSPENLVSDKTPPCFMWHTYEDKGVPMVNSIDYMNALSKHNVPCELHIFPHGGHGMGLANGEDIISKHVTQWTELLLHWLMYIKFIAG